MSVKITMKRLADTTEFSDLPVDTEERHERILDFVGQDIIGFRNEALECVFGELEKNGRENLLPYDADFFNKAASSLEPSQREIARKLAERVITHFMDRFMTMVACEGRNNPLGRDHGLHHDWKVQIRSYPKNETLRSSVEEQMVDLDDPINAFEPVDETQLADDGFGAVLEEHQVTQGELWFPKYWHRWLNRFKDY